MSLKDNITVSHGEGWKGPGLGLDRTRAGLCRDTITRPPQAKPGRATRCSLSQTARSHGRVPALIRYPRRGRLSPVFGFIPAGHFNTWFQRLIPSPYISFRDEADKPLGQQNS